MHLCDLLRSVLAGKSIDKDIHFSCCSSSMALNNNHIEGPFPYEIDSVDAATNRALLKEFRGERTGFVQVGPQKYFFPVKYRSTAQNYWNFQARTDDVWVASFPRSGTTWTQELVWMIANDLNYAEAERYPLTKRSPFFEYNIFMHDEVKAEILLDNADDAAKQDFVELVSTPCYDVLPKMTERRFIKTHFPFSLLPPSVMRSGAKVVYVARNPKDVIVSFYHLNRLYRTQGYIGNFESYWHWFENDLNSWMPYWAHLKEGWQNRHQPNVLFLFYEDMNRDLRAAIRQVAAFLDKSLTDAEIERLHTYLSIENFKHNPSVNQGEMKAVRILSDKEQGFVRNGKSLVQGWQKEYTPEIIASVERWMAKNLADTDMRFPEL